MPSSVCVNECVLYVKLSESVSVNVSKYWCEYVYCKQNIQGFDLSSSCYDICIELGNFIP